MTHSRRSPAAADAASLQVLTDLLDGRHTSTGDPLDAGAELIVTESSGAAVYTAALTRMHRLEPGHPPTLWLRPVELEVSSDPAASATPAAWRRRGLTFSDIRCHVADGPAQELVLTLWNGQVAHIRSAGPRQLSALAAWDELVYNRLPDFALAEMEQLEDDS